MTEGERHYRHGLRRMVGRDVAERHRAASPLELLFDLAFVVSFHVAGNELAHGIAEGHGWQAGAAFVLAMAAVLWAWISYTWFASAFDTDDWLFRLLTMVQMVGVVLLAVGLPKVFESVAEGGPLAISAMVPGYVVMRLAMVGQWIRAAVSDPRHRSLVLSYAVLVGVAQCGWVLVAILPLSSLGILLAAIPLWCLDFLAPVLAERKAVRKGGRSSPWHAHHIAERFSLLAIIAIGETVFGTEAAAHDVFDARGWSLDAIVVVVASVTMSFALWWSYFLLPSAPVLAVRRDKVTPWGYGHLVLLASITAVGGGLHAIGYAYDDHYDVSVLTAITAVAIPVLVFMGALHLLYAWLISALPRDTTTWHAIIAGLPLLAVVLAGVGWPLWACLLVVVASPLSVIVGYELGAWRTLAGQLDRALGTDGQGTGSAGVAGR